MRKAKPITIKIAPDQIDFFGAVLNCAVRYCIGRMTYMPRLVTDWIMQHCSGILTAKTLGVMKRDIDEAAARNGLGMNCDAVTWYRFRDWLEQQESIESQEQRRRCSVRTYRDPTTDCTNMLHMDMMALLEASEDAECGPDYCEIEEGDNGQHDED